MVIFPLKSVMTSWHAGLPAGGDWGAQAPREWRNRLLSISKPNDALIAAEISSNPNEVHMHVLFFLLLALLAGCATMTDLPKEGLVVADQIAVGRNQIALPPGSWTVAAVGTGRIWHPMGSGGETAKVSLQQIEAGIWRASIFIEVSISSTLTQVWWAGDCDGPNRLYFNELRKKTNFPECLMLRPVPRFWAGMPNNDFDRKIYTFIREAKRAKTPATVIGATYWDHYKQDKILIQVLLNPMFFTGLAEEKSWNREEVAASPQQRAFIAALAEWGLTMAASARSTLEDGAPLPIGPLPTVMK